MYRTLIGLPLLLIASAPLFATGLVINPVYDSSINLDPNAATIKATIQSVLDVYMQSFTDSIVVKLEFDEMSSGLGSSQTYVGQVSYSQYRSLLTGDARTAEDFTALSTIPAGSTYSFNGAGLVDVTSANLRALGVSASPPGSNADSIIRLNTSIMNLDRSNVDPNKYDLYATVAHEVDEALGFGSRLNGLANGASVPADYIWGMDLYRFDQNGNRSLNTNFASQAFFSINGDTTTLAQFNQDARGDYSDFFSTGQHTIHIQDAFGTPGSTPNFTVELNGLDVLGYDLAVQGTPEPGTALLFSLTLGALAIPAARRRLKN